ncbi:MAG: nitronate monooxygenase family protein [Alphaproteobacteria bacterium]|nr:nitronate monooxygenase family protein [Alphaproteobacteria bacterium]MCZ6509746.1 nitronate monooxygenase family protein [Alphaproteobacteria bacterium]
MPLPKSFQGRLSLPAVAAPMFLVSGPEIVIAACRAGIPGTFPALNQRTSEGFDAWCAEIGGALTDTDAPYGVNLIVHKTNPRVAPDLEICVKHKVPVIITSLGAVADLVDTVHGYGGVVFHDVTTVRHAQKAAEARCDGLILVCAGAGGHAGTLSPFALLPEIRQFFDGTILLAGALSDGRAVAAAQMLGADLAYFGTRFIATAESQAVDGFKQMIVDSAAKDIIHTPAISGIPGSFLRPSIEAAGFDPDYLPEKGASQAEFGDNMQEERKAWRDVWSAGQGVGQIDDVPSVAELVSRLKREYDAAIAEFLDTTTAAAAQ